MNQATHAAGASAPQALPLKRKRGRPRKDQSLNRFQSTRIPSGFGSRGNQSHRVDKIDDTNGGMVGQPVTGVIEAAFDAGYLLTVRIGNSNTNFRGVVFKPGNYSPITAENDVAPHVQMIKRNEVRFPVENQLQSSNWPRERTELNGSSHVNQVQAFVPQPVNMVAAKGKHTSLTTVPCASMGSRGTVVPVVLQPVNLVNGSPPTNQTPADPSALRDKDVVNAEPLAMLPPAGMSSAQFVMCRNQQKASPVQTSHQVKPRSPQNENGSCNEDRHEIGESNGAKDKKFTDVGEPGEPSTGAQGSSESLETHLENSKSSTENSQMDLDNEICNNQTPYTPKPLKNYGTGRMTELLQALQENMDMHVGHSEGRAADSKAENKGSGKP